MSFYMHIDNCFQDKLENSDIPAIETAMKDAYIEANPGVSSSDIDVTVTIVNNDRRDQDGCVISASCLRQISHI